MAKAILIMDIPSNCFRCRLSELAHCKITKMCHIGDNRPAWCPLREVPQKKDTTYHPCRNPYVTEGYNACIDEILGGAENG